MEPLASLGAVTPLSPPPAAAPPHSDPDAGSARAARRERPIALAEDRVDASEDSRAPRSGRPVDDRARGDAPDDPRRRSEAPGQRGRGDEEEPAGDAERSATHAPGALEEAPEFEPETTTVRYRLRAESATGLQTRVVDRETDEVVRAVPTDEQLELVRNTRRYLGAHLDVRA